MSYPNLEAYEILYARYLKREPLELWRLSGMKEGSTVMDLCAGSGRATMTALYLGAAKVHLVEQEKGMLGNSVWGYKRIIIHNDPMSVVFSGTEDYIPDDSVDVAICQQAVNYWLKDPIVVEGVASKIRKGGVFVFNTFYNKPPVLPRVLQYDLYGKTYVEVSYLNEETGKVYHVQICQGMEPHSTSFDWLTATEIIDILSPYFEVTGRHEGKTSLYKCVRRV